MVLENIQKGIHLVDTISQVVSVYWRAIVLLIAVLWTTSKIIDFIIAWTSVRTVSATVHKTERVFYPYKLKSMYLVYTDKGVFKNEDSWAFLSFNSSDTYAKITDNTTLEFVIYGYRNRFDSDYPNIWKVRPLIK